MALCNLKNKNIDFNKVAIYVCRVNNQGEYRLAKPCPSCMEMIRSLGIKNVYYTKEDNTFGHLTVS